DGKIVVAGTTTATTADFLVARYNADGTPDTSFVAGVGYVAIDFGSADGAVGVAVQPDGKIVVAGTTSPSVRLFALAPLDAGGALDTTFGVGGKATTALPGGTWTAHDMALQADGKVVVFGEAAAAPNQIHMVVARHNTDGTLDAAA